MHEENIYITVRRLLEELKEDTLVYFMNNDREHKEHSSLEEDARSAYTDLELTDLQRGTIDCLIEAKELITSDYATLSYAAGIKDAISILLGFGMIREHTTAYEVQ